MKKILKNVLLIDDDEDDNYFHRLVLEESGVIERVHIAENAVQAFDLLINEKLRPELIFLDLNMPKINGWEFLEQFGAINDNFHPVIIILTTSINPSDEKKAKGLLKIDFFATKPLTLEKLESIITRHFPEGS